MSLISSSTLEPRLGPIRQTYAGTAEFPPITRAYTDVSQVVRESGLLNRARGFYALVGLALAVAFGGAITGFILLGDSWFQLIIAAVFGILFT
ncbi:MAG: acyl-CoA desaturase, partial [Microbacterium sp.]|nr:acyl-CoA desaturase [Microbacterium sp.]